MSFIVTGRGIPATCFTCPLDKGVWKQEQDPFILCRYTKGIVRYDDVPTDRRLPCCGLKEMPEKHGRLIDADALEKDGYTLAIMRIDRHEDGILTNWCEHIPLEDAPTIVEAEGE